MRPSRSWPNSACGGTPRSSNIRRLPRQTGNRAGTCQPGPSDSFLHERAIALVDRAEGFRGWDRGAQLVVVPRPSTLLRLLDLEEIHVVELAPVGADGALAEQLVVRGHHLHLLDDLGAIRIAFQLVHGLEVVQHRRV